MATEIDELIKRIDQLRVYGKEVLEKCENGHMAYHVVLVRSRCNTKIITVCPLCEINQTLLKIEKSGKSLGYIQYDINECIYSWDKTET
jgi:hypothetical protein